MPRVMISPPLLYKKPGPYSERLEAAGFEVVYPDSPGFTQQTSEADLVAAFQGISATLASGELYSPSLLEACPDLRVVSRVGVGYDQVNVPACTERKIAVSITPNANHECVAEHAFALMLDIARTVTQTDREMRSGQWKPHIMQNVRERTLGIIGLGRIGRSMAIRARAFRMNVIAAEQFPNAEFNAEHNIEIVSLDELLKRSDVISVHAPLTEETRGLINKETIAKMKPGVFFVNTARGGLVVEADLIPALESGHIAAAGLDVFEEEPTPADNPLLKLDNVVALPHIGGVDEKSLRDMADEAAANIVAMSKGTWPPTAIVNEADIRETWKWS
ncbi:Glyoxylate/hydroxypyruvate reductase B [Symmachiella dynata]|uniref:phosphoglycerate dehydrogenase n=1 Tax=Symmachiella dynata TaxID=2527995 RepID=UPI00118BDD6E|nr:phosphoglycerate dehydrogenase [Symmachiella dynata]QDT47216.1 Glyoxylate/hydroxypyruvate reductase B [Symmachiella dynata]